MSHKRGISNVNDPGLEQIIGSFKRLEYFRAILMVALFLVYIDALFLYNGVLFLKDNFAER